VTDYARRERRDLADLLLATGPDAPTLCAGWTTRDLAAHLVIRERRVDAMAAGLIPPLSGHTEHVRQAKAARPYPEVVAEVRNAPWWSPLSNRLTDELANTLEFFIHHEDVRRAQETWEPRSPDPVRDAALWKMLKFTGKFGYRRSPVGIVFRRPDGTSVTLKEGPTPVVVTGEPGDLVLLASGRKAVRVEYDGDPAAIEAFQGINTSM
jgi:uncharacterized protein (TIGR03085 family)